MQVAALSCDRMLASRPISASRSPTCSLSRQPSWHTVTRGPSCLKVASRASHPTAFPTSGPRWMATLRTARPPAPSAGEGPPKLTADASADLEAPAYLGIHHVAILVEDMARSMAFYQGVLGMTINPDRPHDKLPYEGAWLWFGDDMLHLMELPNPDPLEGRPTHGGRDRHVCVGVAAIGPMLARLDAAGVPYTASKSGRPAVFFRDPDSNTVEVVEVAPWRQR